MDLYSLLLSFFLVLATYISIEIATRFIIRNSKKKLPPGPIGLPLIGSLLSLGDRSHETLTNLSKTYGPLMTVKLGFNNIVVASSAEMAKEILQKNDMAFMGRPIPDAVTAEKGYDLTLPWLPIGPQWKKLRKLLNTQVLTHQKLDNLQDLRNKMMESMIQRVVEAREAKEAVDIGRLVFGTAVQLLSNTIFSIDMLHPNSNDMKELHLLNANIMLLVGKPNLCDYFSFLRPFDLQGIRREIKVSYDRLHELVDDMIDRHMTSRSLGLEKHGDLLDTLLDLTELDELQGLTRMDIKLLIVEFFIAGTEPITTTVEWAMSELLQNPTILHKTKQEMKERIPFGETVKEQDLPNLPYLKAVMKETMRLHTTAPFLLPHKAEQDVEINGYTIPKNTRVLVNAWSISRDTKYWEEPNIFKPERFMNSEIMTDFRSKDFSFMPFGAGRRICAGMNLAIRMECLIFAILVQKFDWKLPDGSTEIDMTDKYGITLKKAQPLMAIPI